jgi:hypothetical protein
MNKNIKITTMNIADRLLWFWFRQLHVVSIADAQFFGLGMNEERSFLGRIVAVNAWIELEFFHTLAADR